MAAAPLAIPEVLFTQLAARRPTDRAGGAGRTAALVRITKRGDELHTGDAGLVSFVPLLKGLG